MKYNLTGEAQEAHISYSTLELSHLRGKGATVFNLQHSSDIAWALLLEAWIPETYSLLNRWQSEFHQWEDILTKPAGAGS